MKNLQEIIEALNYQSEHNLEELFYDLDIESLNIEEEIDSIFDSLDDDGRIHEKIDGMIDIYTHNLWQWASNNYEYIDQAIEEGLCDSESIATNGILSAIIAGQYCYYSEKVNEEIEELKSFLSDKHDEIKSLLMSGILEEWKNCKCLKLFEVEVLDNRTKEKDYLVFDIGFDISNNELKASRVAFSEEEEKSESISFTRVEIDINNGLNNLLESLHEQCIEDIEESDFYSLVD